MSNVAHFVWDIEEFRTSRICSYRISPTGQHTIPVYPLVFLTGSEVFQLPRSLLSPLHHFSLIDSPNAAPHQPTNSLIDLPAHPSASKRAFLTQMSDSTRHRRDLSAQYKTQDQALQELVEKVKHTGNTFNNNTDAFMCV